MRNIIIQTHIENDIKGTPTLVFVDGDGKEWIQEVREISNFGGFKTKMVPKEDSGYFNPPRSVSTIRVNEKTLFYTTADLLSYDMIVEWSGLNPNYGPYSILYRGPEDKHSLILTPEDTVAAKNGMGFDVFHTGNA